MKFYYGADRLVVNPEFGKGKANNDYGVGFYLTKDKEMARLWASKNVNGGYVIEYDVDLKDLSIINLNTIEDDDVLRWIALLASHRFDIATKRSKEEVFEWLFKNYSLPISGYDVIIGYRADDSYFDYSRDFIQNNLSLELLKDAMRIGKLGIQYVLMSRKAFTKIKYLSSERVEHSEEYALFRRKANNEYLTLKKEDDINNTFIRDLMRRKKND